MRNVYGFECVDPRTIYGCMECKIPPAPMIGTPWYSILCNYRYEDAFQYVGSYIGEREKLIEDGYADTEKRFKVEQSDLVMILLHLAFIPEEVVRDIGFQKPGWSFALKDTMEQYKKKFSKNVNRVCNW